jgi:hypothetical protein
MQKSKGSAMNFRSRLNSYVELCIVKGLGNWEEDGNQFHIYDIESFVKLIEPYNFATLKRQFSYYGFSCTYEDGLIMKNPRFTQFNRQIKKKRNVSDSNGVTKSHNTVKSVETDILNIYAKLEELNKKQKSLLELYEHLESAVNVNNDINSINNFKNQLGDNYM